VSYGSVIALINTDGSLWSDPRLATLVAGGGIALLIATVWLMRRKSREGRGAAAICLVLSIALHGLLICFLPSLRHWGGGAGQEGNVDADAGLAHVTIADFDPVNKLADQSSVAESPEITSAPLAPLPLANPVEPIAIEPVESPSETVAAQSSAPSNVMQATPSSLNGSVIENTTDASSSAADDLLSQWLSDDADAAASKQASRSPESLGVAASSPVPVIPTATRASVPGFEQNDFGQRAGDAKRIALLATGGDDSTEAAVEAALRFLAADQKPDGSWDPTTSGAGRETLTLGTDRGGAGKQATNGITGLALLSMLGAGNTHLQGDYADNVRRGLTYLIGSQKPDGSLAGPASVYESNYCHGMAALAMCEAAAMTGDESAKRSAAAAVRYTITNQHPATGGWRYIKGDPGDLSQLGWQAMVLDGGRRASVNVPQESVAGVSHFLRSVRSGQNGGLASYRPGEAPTRTMTAEALATRLLVGEKVPANEIAEAESFLLRQPPGVGRDNYYGWYYSSLALHQLQDDAWRQWNDAMKARLIARQLPGGSWPTDDEWGGYGGRVYTTAMASLCLEVYYRHALRPALRPTSIASDPDSARLR